MIKIFLGFLFLFPGIARAALSEQEVLSRFQDLERRLTESETNEFLNYFRLAGLLVTSYDNIAVSETYAANHEHNDLGYLRLRLSVDINADVRPRVKIYSRFTTSKFFNRLSTPGVETNASEFGVAHAYASPAVWLEKAYLDFLASDIVTLSAGRLPTVDGMPSHLLDSRPRQGTYPSLNFNIPLDGFAATFKFDESLPRDHFFAIRMLYTPLTVINFDQTYDPYLSPPRDDNSATGTPVGATLRTISEMGAVQFDYSFLNSTLAERSSAVLQVTQIGERPVASMNGTSTMRFNGGNACVYVEAVGLFSSYFDLSASFAHTYYSAHGTLGPGQGLGTTLDESHLYGNAFLLTARYRWQNWSTGAEYTDTSKLTLHYSTSDEDLTGFYRTPGIGRHVWLNYNFENAVVTRFGFQQKDVSNYPVAIGNVINTDRKVTSFYLRIRTDF